MTPNYHSHLPHRTSIKKHSTLKVLCVNCQSVQSTEKRAKFYALLNLHKPDIDHGCTSTFLTLRFGYNPPIRKDRPDDSKGGGVFILVSQNLVVSEQPKLSTDCEYGLKFRKLELNLSLSQPTTNHMNMIR